MSWLGPIFASIIKVLLSAFFERKDAIQQRSDDKDAGTKDASIETLQTINEVANARADLPPSPAAADDLIKQLRDRADRESGGGSPGSQSSKH